MNAQKDFFDDKRIVVGEMHGRKFGKDSVMVMLAKSILHEIPVVQRIELSYAEAEDFYHCRFKVHGHDFDIRYYKAFALRIDGVTDVWAGCPVYKCGDFVDAIAREVRRRAPVLTENNHAHP